MSELSYFFWMAEQAVNGLLYAWPITGILLGVVAAALGVAVHKDRLTVNNVAWSVFPIIVPLALLAWGVVFKATGLDANLRTTWQTHAVYVLLCSQIPVAAFAVWRARHARLLAVAAAVFISHYSFWAAFVVGMSVTDDWI